MGWCSGTVVFDNVLDELLTDDGVKPGPVDAEKVIRVLVAALEDMDWDCQMDSGFWGHPLVRKVMAELHPRWFEGEDEQ